METIEYRVQYTGATGRPGTTMRVEGQAGAEYELVRVRARNINSGYAKVLKRALERLGNGLQREIGGIEFWQIVG